MDATSARIPGRTIAAVGVEAAVVPAGVAPGAGRPAAVIGMFSMSERDWIRYWGVWVARL